MARALKEGDGSLIVINGKREEIFSRHGICPSCNIGVEKPDPRLFQIAADRFKVPYHQCVVIEDSLVGLRAAVAANMKCVITYTSSTANQDFYGEGAVAKVPDLRSRGVTLSSIIDPLRAQTGELLHGLKDD